MLISQHVFLIEEQHDHSAEKKTNPLKGFCGEPEQELYVTNGVFVLGVSF